MRYDGVALNIVTCPTAAADSREYQLCARHLLNLKINISEPLYSSILLPFKLCIFCIPPATCVPPLGHWEIASRVPAARLCRRPPQVLPPENLRGHGKRLAQV